jgi:SAM-dependent methyltransferase
MWTRAPDARRGGGRGTERRGNGNRSIVGDDRPATQKAARSKHPARFQIAGIEAIPAPDDHFDVVLASLMLHHLPPELQQRAFAEVRRVLKPNGRFVALDFSATPSHGFGHLLSVLGLRRGSEHAEKLRSLAAAAGFEPAEIEPTGRGAFSVVRAQAHK